VIFLAIPCFDPIKTLALTASSDLQHFQVSFKVSEIRYVLLLPKSETSKDKMLKDKMLKDKMLKDKMLKDKMSKDKMSNDKMSKDKI
jgi:pentapeptide MXKDX repeat protein